MVTRQRAFGEERDMEERLQFYIDGHWVDPGERRVLDVVNPATEEPFARIALGDASDVEPAVAAAHEAFESFSRTSREDRLDLLRRIVAAYRKRYDDLVETLSREMGAPVRLARAAQVAAGVAHLNETLRVLESYAFEQPQGTTMIRREPIGVCGFITPWNWPVNQIMCKVAPALAAGCTMVLKPTEIAPLNALILAEVFHDAGVPAGVFNLVNGDGPTVGQAIAAHPGVDMVSFTGSTRAGVLVAKAAADGVKRITQELGGKSPNVILDDADLERAVAGGVAGCMTNSGQSCNAPTRMLVPESLHDRAAEMARTAAEKVVVGDPFADGTTIGPVVSETQWKKIQRLIQLGIDQGATLVTGGPGRPQGLERGYYVRPTVFGNVRNDMTIAREEIFGPVLSLLPYRDEDDAVRIANDTPYGLAAYVSCGDLERGRRVASRLHAGQVQLNGARADFSAPFGGYKHSGNGREWGRFGFEEFLEIKAVLGWSPAS
jgi:aldehyde dehydrogenase (NAD+)